MGSFLISISKEWLGRKIIHSYDFLPGKPHPRAAEGGKKQAVVETRFIKFSSKLMRQFDVAGYYYSETVRRDGAAFTSGKKKGIPPFKQ